MYQCPLFVVHICGVGLNTVAGQNGCSSRRGVDKRPEDEVVDSVHPQPTAAGKTSCDKMDRPAESVGQLQENVELIHHKHFHTTNLVCFTGSQSNIVSPL